MTKEQALKIFREEDLPYLKKEFPKDKTAIRTAWNDFTDALCKNGDITQEQYQNWGNPF